MRRERSIKRLHRIEKQVRDDNVGRFLLVFKCVYLTSKNSQLTTCIIWSTIETGSIRLV